MNFNIGKGKQNRKRKLKLKRINKPNMGKIVRFNLSNSPRKYSGFRSKYNYEVNIHNLIYKDAEIENVKYQAANTTKCNFKNTKLIGAEFYNTNPKGTSFKDFVFTNIM